jgi:hypothetical protein
MPGVGPWTVTDSIYAPSSGTRPGPAGPYFRMGPGGTPLTQRGNGASGGATTPYVNPLQAIADEELSTALAALDARYARMKQETRNDLGSARRLAQGQLGYKVAAVADDPTTAADESEAARRVKGSLQREAEDEGRALNADFAGRGMLRSSAYADAVARMMEENAMAEQSIREEWLQMRDTLRQRLQQGLITEQEAEAAQIAADIKAAYGLSSLG